MVEIRCKRCHRLLMKIVDIGINGKVEIKCPKCKEISIIELICPWSHISLSGMRTVVYTTGVNRAESTAFAPQC